MPATPVNVQRVVGSIYFFIMYGYVGTTYQFKNYAPNTPGGVGTDLGIFTKYRSLNKK